MRVVAAAVQMTSTGDLARNLARVAELVARAKARGAELVVLPENFALLAEHEDEKLKHAEELAAPFGPILSVMATIARENRVFLVCGGMPERAPEPGHVYNSCVLLGPDGDLRAAYRKIHLFDVAIPDGATYQESKTVTAGKDPVAAVTPWGPLGLSVCYDLRFPELYRKLSNAGATILVVPAAFTLHTGKDHWHVLLRARAIENQTFVIAAAQTGRHNAKRVTYGHSLIVDPWGIVLAEAGDGEGLAVAELDLDRLAEVRREVPCLGHRKL
jgi:predicted amidohydrolase